MSKGAGPARVAFQGERGAFSEEAAVKLLGEGVTLVPRPTFESLFAATEEGAADLALAPFENTLAGSVHRVYDLLLDSPLHMTAEVVIPIRHFLIGPPGSKVEEIKTVESHPVALAQCERFFASRPDIRRVAADDTAGSVANVLRRGDPSCAAVAGRRAAETYGGQILRAGLEDHPENYTRFVLLAPEPSDAKGADKLSLVLKLAHRPGALHHALEPFARRGIDLLKIESRPLRGQPWEYHFYLDLRGAPRDPELSAALEELQARTASVRVLGHYASAKTSDG
ncbi:MAG: prephenate dehydratase [Acidobacteria bacterium]|nr:prephenate dehydratase [Acidobacteriota bacterium]